jgi:hypothetical protein
MTVVDDIIAERDRARDIVTQQIATATRLKNDGAADMNDKLNALRQQRADISAQAYQAALTDPAMTAALNALKAVTKDMTDVAATMTDVTAFLAGFNSFITAANKVIPVLQGLDGPEKKSG